MAHSSRSTIESRRKALAYLHDYRAMLLTRVQLADQVEEFARYISSVEPIEGYPVARFTPPCWLGDYLANLYPTHLKLPFRKCDATEHTDGTVTLTPVEHQMVHLLPFGDPPLLPGLNPRDCQRLSDLRPRVLAAKIATIELLRDRLRESKTRAPGLIREFAHILIANLHVHDIEYLLDVDERVLRVETRTGIVHPYPGPTIHPDALPLLAPASLGGLLELSRIVLHVAAERELRTHERLALQRDKLVGENSTPATIEALPSKMRGAWNRHLDQVAQELIAENTTWISLHSELTTQLDSVILARPPAPLNRSRVFRSAPPSGFQYRSELLKMYGIQEASMTNYVHNMRPEDVLEDVDSHQLMVRVAPFLEILRKAGRLPGRSK